jgi:hypothetical protein
MSKIVRDFRKTLQAQTPEQKAELRKGVLAWHQKIDGRVN